MTTVKEIAELAKVSIGTVDRVIHNRGRVSPETREKIQKIIDEFGYKPNFYAKNLKRSKNFKFAVLIPRPDQDNKFWQLFLPGINNALQQLEPYYVSARIFHYDRNSGESFHQASQELLAYGPDGFVLAPVVSPVAKVFLAKVPKTIPYVFIDSLIENTNYLVHIGHNSYHSGRVAGKLMKTLLRDEKCSVAVFQSHSREIHMLHRAKGFRDFLADYTNINTCFYDIRGVETDNVFYQLTEKAINEHPDLMGIFVTNAYSHGVAEYLQKNHLKSKISLVGYDLIDENVKSLKDGTIDFLISLRPDLQGYHAIYSLYYHLVQNKTIENEIKIPIDILTSENIDFFKKGG